MTSNTYMLTMLGTDTKYSPEPHQYSIQVLPGADQAFPEPKDMNRFVIYVSVAETGDHLKYSLLVPGKDGAMDRADVGTVYHSHFSNGWADWISQVFRSQWNLMRDIYYRGDQVKFTVKNVTGNLGLHTTIRACAASKGTRLLTAYPRGETLSVLAKVVEQPQDRHRINAPEVHLPAAVIEGPKTLGTDVGVKIKDGLLQLLYVIHTTNITEFVIQGHSRGAVESLMLAHELEHVLKAIRAVNHVSEMNQAWLNLFIQTIQCPYTKVALEELNVTLRKPPSSNSLLALLKGIKENDRSINDIRVSIFALDPVAGNETLGLNKIAWTHNNMHHIPEIVREYVVMVQPNEHSRCFKGTVPAHYNSEKTKVTHLAGIGHHGTLSGNPLDQLGHFFEDDPNGEQTKDAQLMALMELMEFLLQRNVALNLNKDLLPENHPLKSMIEGYVNETNPDERRKQRLECYEFLILNRSAYDRFNHTSYTGEEGIFDSSRRGEPHDRRLHFGSFADTKFSTVFGERSAYFINVNHAKLYLAQEIEELKDVFDLCTNEELLNIAKKHANCFSNQSKFNDAIRILETSFVFAKKSEIATSQNDDDNYKSQDVMSVRDQSSEQFRTFFDQLETPEAKEKTADLDPEHLKMLINDDLFQLSDGDKLEFGNKISSLLEHGAAASSKKNVQDDEHQVELTPSPAVGPYQSEALPLAQNVSSGEPFISRFGLTRQQTMNLMLEKHRAVSADSSHVSCMTSGEKRLSSPSVQGYSFFKTTSAVEQQSLIVPSESLRFSQQDMWELVRRPGLLQDVYNRGTIRFSLQDRGVFRLHLNNYYVDAHLIGSVVHIGGIQIPADLFSNAYRLLVSNAYQLLESGRRQALTWRNPEVAPIIDEDIASEVEHLVNSDHFFDGFNPMVCALLGAAIGLALTASGLFVPFGVGLIGFSLSAIIGCTLGFALGYVALGYASSHEQSAVVPPVLSTGSYQQPEVLSSQWQFVQESVSEDALDMDDVFESESNHSVRFS